MNRNILLISFLFSSMIGSLTYFCFIQSKVTLFALVLCFAEEEHTQKLLPPNNKGCVALFSSTWRTFHVCILNSGCN